MLSIEHIRSINIEISSACNARCPFCSRRQKVRDFGDHFITAGDLRRLPAEFVGRLKRISFGGNFGDLCCHSDLPRITAELRRRNPGITLEGDTNGSFQPQHWWEAVGRHFSPGCMVFALDGLADTHAIHRRGTDFKTVVRNMAAFIRGGGTAAWKFILFEHNAHQVEAAARMAENIGCVRFFVAASRDYDAVCRKPETRHVPLKRELFLHHGAESAAAGQRPICRPFDNGSIYIAADGTVHPCCYAHCMYITEHNPRFAFIVPLIERCLSEINFKTRPLEEILQGPYFSEVLRRSQTNAYCRIKCSPGHRALTRRLVVEDRVFR